MEGVAVRTRPEVVLEAPTALADVPDEQERYQPSSWYYKKLVAKAEAERLAILAKAEAERLAALAKVDTERQAILTEARRTLTQILETRGLSPSAAQRAVLDACGDHATILGWIARSVTAASVDEVLARAT